MTIHGIMSHPVRTVERHESLMHAAAMMVRDRVGSLVVTAAGRPVGMLTQSDIVKASAQGKDMATSKVADHMGRPLVTITDGSTVGQAIATMERNKVRHLAVVVGDQVRGIVTVTDLAREAPEAERRAVDAIRFRWQG